jgi:carboxymethylenebutenolidase
MTVFDEHVRHEFEDHDVEATMKTMVKEPYVHHVPTLTATEKIKYGSEYT